MSFHEKIVFISGASRGIGRAIAEKLLKLGAAVVGTATTAEGAESISKFIQEKNGKGFGRMLNVCDPEKIDALADELKNTIGSPHILINNAAITQDNLLMRMKEDQWDQVINTNLNSIFRMTRAFMRPMIKARWGRIINISSVVALTGNFGQANYTAAKAGVIGYTKTAALELAMYGITVNVVAPGMIETDMTKAIPEKQQEMIQSRIPAQRAGKPEEIAAAVAFLASDDAAYITGETLNVNGGFYMG